MIVYRAETSMASTVREKLARSDEARALLRQVCNTARVANAVPVPGRTGHPTTSTSALDDPPFAGPLALLPEKCCISTLHHSPSLDVVGAEPMQKMRSARESAILVLLTCRNLTKQLPSGK